MTNTFDFVFNHTDVLNSSFDIKNTQMQECPFSKEEICLTTSDGNYIRFLNNPERTIEVTTEGKTYIYTEQDGLFMLDGQTDLLGTILINTILISLKQHITKVIARNN